MSLRFRAEQVGSLLRPLEVLRARAAHTEGRLKLGTSSGARSNSSWKPLAPFGARRHRLFAKWAVASRISSASAVLATSSASRYRKSRANGGTLLASFSVAA